MTSSKLFLDPDRIVAEDEKWTHYANSKRENSWKSPSQPIPLVLTSAIKQDIYASKVMLCIRWDQKGILSYELLKPGETADGTRYRDLFEKLSQI